MTCVWSLLAKVSQWLTGALVSLSHLPPLTPALVPPCAHMVVEIVRKVHCCSRI